jgi:hypothetical protein
LRVESKGSDQQERYSSIRHRMSSFHLRCPATDEDAFCCIPFENDLDDVVGMLVWKLIAPHESVDLQIIASRLTNQSCKECKLLVAELRAPTMTRWKGTVI